MVWLGGYRWLSSVVVGIATSASIFAMFEIWFKVPLPKRHVRHAELPRLLTAQHGVKRSTHCFTACVIALSPFNLLLMLIGVVLGVIIGVLPGLGGANGIAILLPLTFTMPPTSAIIMLSCIYWERYSAGLLLPSFSTFRASRGRSRPRSTVIPGAAGARGEALTGAFTSSFIGALWRSS
jgi:hypothetical protein